jgi:hypothetical protein
VAGIGVSKVFKRLHGNQKVKPSAKAGFSNHKARVAMCLPTFNNAISTHKYILGFIDATVIGKVYVAKMVGDRGAVFIEMHACLLRFHRCNLTLNAVDD